MERPVETDRLILRRPQIEDAEAIFTCYASDPDVTRYVGWLRHRSIEDSRAFLDFSASEWERWPVGPLMILDRIDGALIGSTGLAFETAHRASTGYVLASDAWGRGLATEALHAVVELAKTAGLVRLHAYCYPDHRPSARVLEKTGFHLEATLQRHSEFPNLERGVPADVLCYARIVSADAGT